MEKPPFDKTLEKFLALRQFYRQYETPESSKVISSVKDVTKDLYRSGVAGTFLLNGSLAYGMYMQSEKSDIDLRFFGYVEKIYGFLDSFEGETLNLRLKDMIEAKLSQPVTVNLIGTIDLYDVKEELACDEGPFSSLVELYGFAKYELNIDGFAYSFLKQIERKRKTNLELDYELTGDNIFFRCTHCLSFQKYNRRLRDRGIPIPDRIYQLLAEID